MLACHRKCMEKNNSPICFILLPGFSPDNFPVLNLKDHLEKRGHTAIANNFYGEELISDFSTLTAEKCRDNLGQTIREAKKKHEKVIGIGVSLGGALLLDHAKAENNLDAIISIGTPFKVKNIKLINAAEKFLPLVKPFWRIFDQRERRLPPIAATKMVMEYLCHQFPQNLEKITTPTLFIHSKKDKITDYRILEEYTEKLSSPQKEIIFFDNGSHVINGGTEKMLNFTFDFLDNL
jgi:esterase/lipase